MLFIVCSFFNSFYCSEYIVTDIILENFPIKGTVERIGKTERDMNKGFDAKDVVPEGNIKKKIKG